MYGIYYTTGGWGRQENGKGNFFGGGGGEEGPFVRGREMGRQVPVSAVGESKTEGRGKGGTAPSSGAGLMPAPPPTLCCGRGAPFTIPPFRALPPKTLRTAAIVTCRPISLPLTHYALPGPLPLGGGCTSLQFSWLNDRRFPAMDFPLFHMAAPAKAHSCSTCRALSKATERFLPGIVDGPNKQIYQAFAGAKTW
ncbi:hypothetical protein CLOSTASPAR_05407 [[Clostridium] asparagiforme DSM 15981]|uniref:Uncharacterized protein n=1 Tax=[Clostridium] asparagiforme DSM 15981 TaxID=518636 RepID=C0D809_9FIRM|nr:hypothetical protein CLOSTASPAR_05407 [[Clostridium] asparagiforme DSM 15981]